MRRGSSKRSGRSRRRTFRFSDALVVVAGHVGSCSTTSTHRVTLIRVCAEMRPNCPALKRGLADYELRPVDRTRQRAERDSRPRARWRHRWTVRHFLDRVATRKAPHLRRRHLPAASRHPFLGRDRRRFGRSTSTARSATRNPSPYMFYIEHGGEARVRRLAGVSRAARRQQGADASRSPALVRAAPIPRKTPRSRPNCWPTKKSAPST